MISRPVVGLVAPIAILGAYLAVALAGADERGIVAEEAQPYLARHPVVLERTDPGGAISPMPPHEPGGAPPRWVATRQWPQLVYDGAHRMWPILIRGHQTALGSYVGIALGPALGGGIAGVRRANVLLGLALLGLTFVLARRLAARASSAASLLALAVLALGYGTIWLARTGYGFELASRVAMVAALVGAAHARPLTTRAALGVGLGVGLAILCRATVAITLAPALAILLADPRRRPSRRALAGLVATGAGLPIAVFAAITLLVPLAAGTAPLADIPFASLWERSAQVPDQLRLQLAWLGDPVGILGGLMRGASSPGSLLVPALLGALAVGVAAARWWSGRAGDGERMLCCAVLANVIAGAWLYGSPYQFQLALALEPLFALAVAEQVTAIPTRRLFVGVTAIALVARGQGLVVGAVLEDRIGNPMVSGRVQRAAVAHVRALGLRGPELLTTTYNHAGVLEAWTDGWVRPIHAWPVLRSQPDADPAKLAATWRELLATARPGYILLCDVDSLYAGPFTRTDAIAAGLDQAAGSLDLRLSTAATFATEAGTPGWSLVRVTLRP
jgi:hypothetical protein